MPWSLRNHFKWKYLHWYLMLNAKQKENWETNQQSMVLVVYVSVFLTWEELKDQIFWKNDLHKLNPPKIYLYIFLSNFFFLSHSHCLIVIKSYKWLLFAHENFLMFIDPLCIFICINTFLLHNLYQQIHSWTEFYCVFLKMNQSSFVFILLNTAT